MADNLYSITQVGLHDSARCRGVYIDYAPLDLRSIEVPFLLRMISSTGKVIGRDGLFPVDDYQAPFLFSGVIRRLEMELPQYQLPGEKAEEAETKQLTEMARQ